MTADKTGLVILIAAVAVESFAQLSLKVGASGGPGILSPPFRRYAARNSVSASAAGWIVLGVLCYGVEIALYTLALNRLDVSVAFPVGSLCFAGVAVLSKLFLGEAVGRARWLGVLCILAGAILVAL